MMVHESFINIHLQKLQSYRHKSRFLEKKKLNVNMLLQILRSKKKFLWFTRKQKCSVVSFYEALATKHSCHFQHMDLFSHP